MWELYDELVNGIDDRFTVDEVVCGASWSAVRSGKNVGVAMTVDGITRQPERKGEYVGAPLKEVARGVKSWNYLEASVGLAAINAYYNTPEKASENGIILPNQDDDPKKQDAFTACREEFRGKNVCVIGHFPGLYSSVAPICNLSILERNPQDGDYPDPACEFLLPKQDFVFITGCTVTNKTLPRLLELSKNASVVMVGPSVPLSPILFKYGVDNLSGFIVTEPDKCILLVESGIAPVFKAGVIIRFLKNNGSDAI